MTLRGLVGLTPAQSPAAPTQVSYGPETAGMNKDTMQFNCEAAKGAATTGAQQFVGVIIPGPVGKWAGTVIGNGVGGMIKCGPPPAGAPMPPLAPIPPPPLSPPLAPIPPTDSV